MPDPAGISIRAARESDLAACHRIWRDGLDGYLGPLGFPLLPEENTGVQRLHRHTLESDPVRFMVAERAVAGSDIRVVAFGSALDRGPLWFLSMLFVDPAEQARGVGRALLQRMLPAAQDGRILATCTDAAQPASNGLYASLGIVPSLPIFNLVGRPRTGFEWPPMPAGVRIERVSDAAAWGRSDEAAAFDTRLLGFARPQDHAFVQAERRHLFAARDGAGTLVGYGYAGDIGRLGPIAVTDPDLLAPLLGHMLTTVVPRGASAVWLPGGAGPALASSIRAGLRIEGFPVLACWSSPFTDYARYVPMSPGLV